MTPTPCSHPSLFASSISARAMLGSVVVVGLVLAVASGVYVARHFAINSDINTLLSSDLGWRKHELAFEQAFRRFERIFVVVEAPTPELTSEATAALTQELAKNKDRFRAVTQLGGGEFFATQRAAVPAAGGSQAQSCAAGAGGAAHPRSRDRSELARARQPGSRTACSASSPIASSSMTSRASSTMASDTLEKVIKGEPASFSWRVLVAGPPGAAKRAARLHRGAPGARLQRAGGRPRRH